MWLYILIASILILFCLIAFIPRLEPFRRKFGGGFNFLLTVVATLIGVFIAIALTNYEEARQEKQNVVKLLEIANANLKMSYAKLTVIQQFPDQMAATYLADTSTNVITFVYPGLFDKLMQSDIVLRNLSQVTLTMLTIYIDNLKNMNEYSFAKAYDPMLLEKFRYELFNVTDMMDTEILYQQGRIDKAELIKRLSKLTIAGKTLEEWEKTFEEGETPSTSLSREDTIKQGLQN